ncbi:MAG: V4R domain-containing protein [Nitrososphaerales archaeon]
MVAKSIQGMGAGRLEVYRKFIERGRRQGYGEFKVPVLQSIISGMRGGAKISLRDSFFATASGKTGQVECWLIADMIAGAARKILGRDKVVVREKCASKGDPHCEFRMKSARS